MQQTSFGRISTRLWQGDAKQGEKLCQALPAQGDAHVNRRKLEQAGNGACGFHTGVAHTELGLQKIGCAFVAQSKHRPAAALCLEGQALVVP